MDKNQAMIDYLNTCPAIQSNPLFFNFINAKENYKQLITLANDKIIHRSYIDGSVLKRYSLTLIDFKTIAYQALVNIPGYTNEDVEEMLDVQDLMDWITAQNKARIFPNFGDDCQVEEIRTTTDNPNLDGVDTSVSPPQAKYSFSIEVDYLDSTDVLWRKE